MVLQVFTAESGPPWLFAYGRTYDESAVVDVYKGSEWLRRRSEGYGGVILEIAPCRLQRYVRARAASVDPIFLQYMLPDATSQGYFLRGSGY